jgi:hypothetical protein
LSSVSNILSRTSIIIIIIHSTYRNVLELGKLTWKTHTLLGLILSRRWIAIRILYSKQLRVTKALNRWCLISFPSCDGIPHIYNEVQLQVDGFLAWNKLSDFFFLIFNICILMNVLCVSYVLCTWNNFNH